MMLQFSESRNKSWIFWHWFVQISDLRQSSAPHFSWISQSLTLYPYIEMAGLVIFQKEMEERFFFRPNQILFLFLPNYFQMHEKANHTEELHTAVKLECKSSSEGRARMLGNSTTKYVKHKQV